MQQINVLKQQNPNSNQILKLFYFRMISMDFLTTSTFILRFPLNIVLLMSFISVFMCLFGQQTPPR